LRSVSLRVGKGAASLLLGLVDHLSRVTHLDQPRKTERGNELCTGSDARYRPDRPLAETRTDPH
jgi:hypothetical protein